MKTFLNWRIYVKIVGLAIIMIISGFLGIVWLFGECDSIALFILSKPAGIAMLAITYHVNECLKKERQTI